MPWRLVIIILIGAAFLGFIGFNLENRCDVSLGFTVFSQIPVFLTALSAFVLGMVLTLPLVISFRAKSPRDEKDKALPLSFPFRGRAAKKEKAGKNSAADDPVKPPSPGGDHGIE
ncbi:MAG: hypothetical protein LBH51_02975 [Treponema sp.]|jgi:uncharacterized integral membrane protein|nr:hypothetical protein [Treponema sp.]